MDFKKLFRKDDKAVSPVIGVILMVAITVILAAAIGSSVFSHGTAQSAPQANLNIKPQDNKYSTTEAVALIKVENLGGDTVNLGSESTKVLIAIDNTATSDAKAVAVTNTGADDANATGTLGTGEIKYFKFTKTSGTVEDVKVKDGQTAHIKFVDLKSGQIFLDKDVTF